MIEADVVEIVHNPAHTVDPPCISLLLHHVPAIKRMAPALAVFTEKNLEARRRRLRDRGRSSDETDRGGSRHRSCQNLQRSQCRPRRESNAARNRLEAPATVRRRKTARRGGYRD